MRSHLFLAALLAAGLALAGCGGNKSHDVTPGTAGSLEGVRFQPADHSLDVDQDTDPLVYWPDGYTPPARFTVALRKVSPDSDTNAVMTNLSRRTGEYAWEVRPVGSLDAQSIYFLYVTGDEGTVISMFLSGGTVPSGEDRSTKPMPDANARAVHEVVVTRNP